MTPTPPAAPEADTREELLPCPFCGGAGIEKWADGGAAINWIQCGDCGAKGPHSGRIGHDGSGSRNWNRRAASATQGVKALGAGKIGGPLSDDRTGDARPAAASTVRENPDTSQPALTTLPEPPEVAAARVLLDAWFQTHDGEDYTRADLLLALEDSPQFPDRGVRAALSAIASAGEEKKE